VAAGSELEDEMDRFPPSIYANNDVNALSYLDEFPQSSDEHLSDLDTPDEGKP